MSNIMLKDMKKLRGVKRFFDDGLVAVKFCRNDCSKLTVYTLPVHGYFKNCFVRFELRCKDYPHKKPTLKCLTKIFHPNVSSSGSICFSMFAGHWKKEFRITDYLNGILFHLNHPNPLSPLSSASAIKDPVQYAECVSKAACGEKVKGFKYDFCFVDSSRIKDSVDFASKADSIHTTMNRYEIIAKVNMTIDSKKSAIERMIPTYQLDDLRKDKLSSLYIPIFEDILAKNLERMRAMVDDVSMENLKESEEYMGLESECMSLVSELDAVYRLESKLVTLSNRLVKTFGTNTEIFVNKFKPFMMEMNEIVASRVRNIYTNSMRRRREKMEEEEEEEGEVVLEKKNKIDNSCVIIDNTPFNRLFEKVEMFEKTNKLMFEFLADVEKCWKGEKAAFIRFEKTFREMKKFVDSNLVLIKLTQSSQRVSQRISNLPSHMKTRESKFFLKELIVELSPIEEETEGEIVEEEEEEEDTKKGKRNRTSTTAIVVSNGRNFVDFDALSNSIKSRVEFYKRGEQTKAVPNIKSIPFFFCTENNMPVIFNADIFNDLGENDMVYFASGSQNYLIGMEKLYLKRYVSEKMPDSRVCGMRTRVVNTDDLRKYEDKNYSFYFNDGSRRKVKD